MDGKMTGRGVDEDTHGLQSIIPFVIVFLMFMLCENVLQMA